MIWTLIIVAVLSDGPSIAQRDFLSKELCMTMARDVQQKIGNSVAMCVQKSALRQVDYR